MGTAKDVSYFERFGSFTANVLDAKMQRKWDPFLTPFAASSALKLNEVRTQLQVVVILPKLLFLNENCRGENLGSCKK